WYKFIRSSNMFRKRKVDYRITVSLFLFITYVRDSLYYISFLECKFQIILWYSCQNIFAFEIFFWFINKRYFISLCNHCQRNCAFYHGKLFSNTISLSNGKWNVGIWYNFVLTFIKSFRFELFWVFPIFRIHVHSCG